MVKKLSRKLAATVTAIVANTTTMIVLAIQAPELLSPELLLASVAGNLTLGAFAVKIQGEIDTP